MDILLDEVAAGRLLGGDNHPIAPRTLQRWRLEGTGPRFVRVGRLIRYRESELRVWLDARTRESTAGTR